MLEFADMLMTNGPAAIRLRDALWQSMYGPTGPAGVTGTLLALGGHMSSSPTDRPTTDFAWSLAAAGATAASWQQQLLLAGSPGTVQWRWASTVRALLGVTGPRGDDQDVRR